MRTLKNYCVKVELQKKPLHLTFCFSLSKVLPLNYKENEALTAHIVDSLTYVQRISQHECSTHTHTHTHTHTLFSLLHFQNVLLRSVFLDVLPLLSNQLGVSISSPRKRVCGFNWPFDLHRFDLILTEWRVLFSPRRLLFPPGPVPRVSVCAGCVHGCLWVLLYVRASKSRPKCVCARDPDWGGCRI